MNRLRLYLESLRRRLLARLRGRPVVASKSAGTAAVRSARRVTAVREQPVVTPSNRAEILLGEAQYSFAHGNFADALQRVRYVRSQLGGLPAEPTERLWRRLTERCRLVSLRSARVVSTVQDTQRIHGTRLYRNGRYVLTGGSQRAVHFWDLQARECVRRLNGHRARVLSVDLSADGAVVLSGSADGSLGLWQGEDEHGRMLEGHTSLVSQVSLSADGRRGLSGSYDHTLRWWDLENGQCLRVLEGHSRQIEWARLGKDGSTAVSGSYEGEVRVWDVAAGACRHTIAAHAARITAMDLSADGRRAVSAGLDGRIVLWDTHTGNPLATLAVDGMHIGALALCANSDWVFCATADGEVGLWDTASGSLVGLGDTVPGGISTASLSSDCCSAVTASPDGTLRLWELDWDLAAP